MLGGNQCEGCGPRNPGPSISRYSEITSARMTSRMIPPSSARVPTRFLSTSVPPCSMARAARALSWSKSAGMAVIAQCRLHLRRARLEVRGVLRQLRRSATSRRGRNGTRQQGEPAHDQRADQQINHDNCHEPVIEMRRKHGHRATECECQHGGYAEQSEACAESDSGPAIQPRKVPDPASSVSNTTRPFCQSRSMSPCRGRGTRFIRPR